MHRTTHPITGLLCAIAFAFAAPVQAATPKNTFVMAKDIADIITMDPAEAFELTTGEIIANLYDRIMMFEPENLQELAGGVAESHTVSDDGKTITFKVRDGLEVPLRQPGTPGGRRVLARARGQAQQDPGVHRHPVRLERGQRRRSGRSRRRPARQGHHRRGVLPRSGVERALGRHRIGGRPGTRALPRARRGPRLRMAEVEQRRFRPLQAEKTWKANETVVLEANPDYRHGAPGMKRVILRHVPEPSAQRLLVEKGDIDMARNLTPDQIKGIEGNADIVVDGYPKGTVFYLAANASHPILGKSDVVQALRHAVDYQGMASSFLAGQFVVHQAFWPGGLWAAYTETPYRLDVAKAKSLLERAGHGDGFEIRIDTLTNSPFPEIAQSIQATLAQAGIQGEHRDPGGQDAVAEVPRAQARADPRPLVAGLRRPALQRRRLRAQPGQSSRSEAHRRARLAQRMGPGRQQRAGGHGAQRAGPRHARAAVPRPAASCRPRAPT